MHLCLPALRQRGDDARELAQWLLNQAHQENPDKPRMVLSATGLYRDHFPNAIQQLARAAQLAAEADREPDNAVATHTARIRALLKERGLDEDSARDAAQTRIFSSEQGLYGSGLDDAALATDTWEGKEEGDHKLARLYLSRMQYAYGPDPRRWGKRLADIMSQPTGGSAQAASGGSTAAAPGASPDGTAASTTANAPGAPAEALNLYAEQLRGTEGAVLSRSSNLYGMLTTDDPFQYLGGIGLAVRHLDGKAPDTAWVHVSLHSSWMGAEAVACVSGRPPIRCG